MPLNIKNKIRLGTLFLFLLLVLSGGVSIYYLVKLKNEARVILKNNYESLDYCHHMQKQLDSIRLHLQPSLSTFEHYLEAQERNITEPGEGEETQQVRQLFTALAQGDTSDWSYARIADHIQMILSLNMAAIERKNSLAQQSSESASGILIMIVVLTFLIGLTFAYNFPDIVVTPVKKLTEAIKEISRKNYKHRIYLENKDEFGQLAEAFNEMSARLEHFESSNLNRIIFEKTRAEAVINSLKDASIGIDKNDTVLFANAQALQLLGETAEETVGKPVAELSARNDLFRFLINNDSKTPFKIVVDGKENYYIKELIEIAQGDASNKMIVLENITSFKELDVAKTNFIATISHELKTPLASSDFSLKLLEDSHTGQLTDEQKELVQHLKDDNQRMLRILSELLNMSQVEAGKIQLNIQSIDPRQVVEVSVKAVTTAAKEKNITIEQKSEKELPAINADPDKVGWVLNNFLTNAIRYSPSESTVLIDIKRMGDKLSFAVTDKGMGIDKIYQRRIFDRYFQIPGRSDKNGSGIGLAICKEFIEAMGGRIWVKSEPGYGSTFGFDLPHFVG